MAFKEVQDIQLDNPKFVEVQDIPLDEPEQSGIQETEQPSEDGFFERVGEDIFERTQTIEGVIERSDTPLLDAPIIGAVALGQAAGAAGDIVAEAISSGVKTILPEKTKKNITNALIDFSQTKVGKLGISAIQAGQESFSKFEEEFPDAAVALGSMLNIFGLSVATKGAKLTAKELADVGGDLSTIVGKTFPKEVENAILPITRKAIEKSIRPSVGKGKTAAQADKFFRDANEAVHTIIENKQFLGLTDDAGEAAVGLPTNLRQFTQAIGNTKKQIFEQYDKIAKLSGVRGAEVDLSQISKELDVVINNKGILPEARRYASEVKGELEDIGRFSAEEAQTRIQSLNNKLSAITDFNSASQSSIDSLVANKLRESLNDVIEQTTGGQYKELKRKYGALKEIERDVNRRAMVDARKNVKGLIDFTDVFTGAEVVRGIISMSPATIGAGLTGKAIASFTKALNDPNRIVKNMFSGVENTINKSKNIKRPFKPKSKTIKAGLAAKQRTGQFLGQSKTAVRNLRRK